MREYDSKEYRIFRNTVKNRDKRCCRWPACGKKSKLQVHHIMQWAKYPHLRFVPENGITLCKKHHSVVRGKEMIYAEMFINIIKNGI